MEENPTVTGEFTARYTIERELGRGGAAVVYLARDNRQERHVALKVLHKELAQAIGAQRFLREIKHSSALQHPHLLTILDSGESRGTLYFVMPHMADGSLRTRIAREKQLPMDDALRITKDVGEALAYAHSKGIVHRDIKPDNVLFSADHACLADFGIARTLDSVSSDTLTSTGLVVGTPAYMSPEQASGEKTVDARSDQYSLACLLYEMITGLPPFIGATQQSVISQRFTQPPPSMRGHRPNVPDHVERAVKRALAVVPADRFASVNDFIAALHDSTVVAAPPSAHSIRRRWFAAGAAAAVVTLAVVAAKPGAEWVRGAWGTPVDTTKIVVLPFLSEGTPGQGERIAASLYSSLSRWEGLPLERDMAVRDVLASKGGAVTTLSEAIAVARELGAGKLLWGRVSSDGQGARVNADLYDVKRRSTLSGQSVTSASGIFADSTLGALANGLLAPAALSVAEDNGENGTRSFPAWYAYTRGAAALARWDLAVADAQFKTAVDADADFALAQLRFAQVASWLRPNEHRTWIVNVGRAVALRGELRQRDVLRAEALLEFDRLDNGGACDLYRRLVHSDTLEAAAWFSLGGCLRSDSLVVPDPRSASRWSFRSSWDAAGKAFVRALEMDPRLHAIPRFDWIRMVFPIDRNRIRIGLITGDSTMRFAARPTIVGDSVAYTPYPLPNFDRQTGPEWNRRQSRALARNSSVLLDIATSWARTFPRSADASLALAALLENRGELSSPTADRGALQTLRKARTFATSPVERLAAGESEVRILVKLGQYVPARQLADSLLKQYGEPTPENWQPVARLAGLTGKLSVLAAALEHSWTDHAQVPGLDPSVARAAGEFLARASLAVCGGAVTDSEKTLRQLVASRVQPERHAEIRAGVIDEGRSYLAQCTAGMSMATATRTTGPIERAQTAFARGNRRTALAVLDTMQRTRAMRRPGDISVNRTVREAALYFHLGDSAAANRLLAATLDAAPTISATILQHPLENAMLVRAMIMHAEYSARRDPAAARRSAAAAAALWAGADAPLAPIVRKMEAIARTGSL